MNVKFVEKCRNFLLVQFNHWSFFPVLIAVILYAENLLQEEFSFQWIGWAICMVQPYVSRFLADHCEKKWVFICSETILFVGLTIVLKMFCPFYPIYIIAMFVYTLCTLNMKITHNKYLHNEVFSLVVPIISSLVAILFFHNMDKLSYDSYFIYCDIVLIVLYILYFYLDKYLKEMKVNTGTAGNMPSDAIFKSGFKALVLFLGLLLPLMIFISNLEAVKTFFDLILDLLLRFIRFIFSLLPTDDGTTFDPSLSEINQVQAPIEADENPVLRMIFDVVFTVIIGAVMLVVLELIAVSLFRFFKRFFVGKLSAVRESESRNSIGDIREKLVTKEKNRIRKSIFRTFTIEDKIRKLYYKTLSDDKNLFGKNTENSENSSSDCSHITAREYEDKKNYIGFADIYEKARYSGQVCDKEDYKRMKESIK